MAVIGTVLAVRALGLGDLLTAVPALRGLRRAYPGSVIELAAPAWLAPMLAPIGAVDRLVAVDDLRQITAMSPPPDLVVNLHGRGPQSVEAAARTGSDRVLTHRHPDHPELDGPEWDDDQHEVQRWCRLVRWGGVEADPCDLRLARLRPATETPSDAAGSVLIHPGASAAARRWPVERFGAVAAALARRGHQVVVTGSAAEFALANAVVTAADVPKVGSVAGRFRLDELAGLVADASLVISGDTGVAHLATAYGTPSVLLFGPTPPALWGPPAGGPHLVLWHGGRGDPHGSQPDPSLLAIDADEALRAAESMLDDETIGRGGSPQGSQQLATS